MTTPEVVDRPLLRVLKCAAKLHKAGLTAQETQAFITCAMDPDAGEGGKLCPPASTPPHRILLEAFSWAATLNLAPGIFWPALAEALERASVEA